MEYIIFAAASFVLTFAGIKVFLGWLNKKEIFDIPNERSSHQNPTPVGGGIVIALVSLALFFIFLVYANETVYWSYFGGAIIIGFISWLDDLRSVPVAIRFLCHSLAAALVLIGFGVGENYYIPLYGDFNFGFLTYLIWFFWIVWLINAYNFMDGIDGIAGTQALLASLSWLSVAWFTGNHSMAIFSSVLAAANLAFLTFNWQPAKIFMGDVGSAFLGYTFAVLPLFFLNSVNRSENLQYIPLVGILFVWLFFFDTVRTLLIRLLNGEKFWQAHRRHIYQQFIIKGFAHRTVTVMYGILTLLICCLAISCYVGNFISELSLVIAVAAISISLQAISLYMKPFGAKD